MGCTVSNIRIYNLSQIFISNSLNLSRNGETKILRIVMHSTADPLLTEIAMQESDKNTRKIILATNIAESSITVPNVKYGKNIRFFQV